MSDFNLIPASYQVRIVRARMQRLGLFTTVALVASGLLAFVGLHQWVEHTRIEVVDLEREQAVSARQRTLIATLNRQKLELDQQWRLLESLRSGMPAKQMMEAVQEALTTNELWFLTWNLQRAGIVTEKETAPNQPGYFIIVKRKGATEDWRSATHMTITGQAWDHSKLSDFVQRLLAQPQILDVRVQRTAQHSSRDRQPLAVNFDLAIVFRTGSGRS